MVEPNEWKQIVARYRNRNPIEPRFIFKVNNGWKYQVTNDDVLDVTDWKFFWSGGRLLTLDEMIN